MTDYFDSRGVNRTIIYRTPGHRSGPITRLMSPSDLGEYIKPFVFLDMFEFTPSHSRGFNPHPHSGIATLTAFFEGHMTYGDTTGKQGSMSDGSVEWMRSGSGVWHAGEPSPGSLMRGFQLWVALPPELELAPAESLYFEADRIEHDGPARILLGHYNARTSPVPSPSSITYLHVRLSDGESWTYQPQADHDIAWLATNAGKLEVGDALLERELAIFEEGNEAVTVTALGAAEFVIGSAARHPYPLIQGASSVHTNTVSLAEGERTIASIRHSAAFSTLASRK
ncbi:pirin family protein [Dickeya dianthicola]|uniref:pirin family protein n=1 Tax=Dickeya dianthicola TaxID=204039 RepID=UPI001F6199EC|nr:pirin family protein [Dickeya dianthicola]MCI4184663.1 pirin family protein [Dickeya dianthicola]